MIITRKLFTEAGLDPNTPPTTWAVGGEGRQGDRRSRPRLYGYGDYSASPVGGWHFTSEVDAMGGQIVGSNGQAAFNSPANAPQATAILQALHQMRFVDHSMKPDPSSSPGAPCSSRSPPTSSGLYIAAPDDIYTHHRPGRSRQHKRLRHGPAAQHQQAPRRARCPGGNGYMFATIATRRPRSGPASSGSSSSR